MKNILERVIFMKHMLAKGVQELFKNVSIKSVGRSAPIGIYEERVRKELRDTILDIRKNKGL